MRKNEAELYYQRIYEYLLEEISSGKLMAGTRLPSEKELCQKFQVSRTTTKRALELLTEQGMIARFPGKGSFVTDARERGVELKSGSVPQTIGFIIPDFSDSFGIRLINGIGQTCDSLGYHLILKKSWDSIQEEATAINTLTDLGVGGILIVPVHGEYYNTEILKLILNHKALVFVDRKMRGLAVPSVSTDNAAAAILGAEYLLGLGHRHIAFYSGPIKDTSTVEDRRTGFLRAFSLAGIPFNVELFCNELSSNWSFPYRQEWVDRDIELVRHHLAHHPEVSAAFVAEYNMALIVREAAESLGRAIPDEFSILCFDAPASVLGKVGFTHIAQDEFNIGKQAMEVLHAIITGKDVSPTGETMLPAKLVVGASTERYKII